MTIDFNKIRNKLVNMFKMITKDDHKEILTFDEVMMCIQDGNSNYKWFDNNITDELKAATIRRDD